MKTEKGPLTAEESLSIITEMIQQAKGNVQGNSFYFLLWGWVIVIANLGHYALLKLTSYPYPYIIWLISVPAYIYSVIHARRSRHENVRTHLDKIHTSLWLAFGVGIPIVLFFGRQVNFQINAIIMLLAAVPTFVSGVILNFKPLVRGGIVFWIAATASFLLPTDLQYPVMALAIVFGYLVPGYLLKKIE